MRGADAAERLGDGDATEQPTSEYFHSYSDAKVHKLMLKDKPRTLAYKDFIEKNAHLFCEKVVLDVGAGSGILSLFAARAGAKSVFAIEASDMAEICSQVVTVNKYDTVITVIKGLVEEVELPVKKVDIIVSEWMGFYLLHEGMLDSVLFARDKWLAQDGFMVPSRASLFCSPVNMSDYCCEHFDYWKDVYGFDFTPLQVSSMQNVLQQPVIEYIKPSQCLAKSELLFECDLKEVKLTEIIDIEEKLTFPVDRSSTLHGFATWFDVEFNPKLQLKVGLHTNNSSSDNHNSVAKSCDRLEAMKSCHESLQPVTLSTSPSAENTHWKQTVCFLPSSLAVNEGDTLYCKVSLSQDTDNKRQYNISLEMLDDLDDTDSDYDDGEDFDLDTSQHPMPCDCGAGKCKIIGAIMAKYDAEQTELELEAEFTDVTAEVQAAQELDEESMCTDSSLLEIDAADSDGVIDGN